jgi:ABC-type polysaccharide/polyol phosphate export permease
MRKKIKEILSYKQLVMNLVSRDLKVKYGSSILGFFWSLLNPLVMMAVYTIVFRNFMKIGKEDFPIFLMCGFLPWNFFSTSLSMSATSITGASNLVKKVYFPREILPISVTLSNLVQFLLTFIILFPSILFFDVKIDVLTILWGLPFVIIVHLIFTLGFAFLISALNVYYSDVQHFLEIVIMVWFWMTPIIYDIAQIHIPDKWKIFITANPMTSIIYIYRYICMGSPVDLSTCILLATGWAIVSFFIGLFVFGRLKRRFGEEL